MKNKFKYMPLFFIIVLAILSSQLSAKKLGRWERVILKSPEKVSELIANKKIITEQIPNPHWNDENCGSCHAAQPSSNNLQLKSDNHDQFCNYCHAFLTSHNYVHPTEIKISSEMLSRMGSELKESINHSEGKLSCITCHDLSKQCLQKEAYQKAVNPSFLRGDSYKSRTETCFQCHLEEAYQKLNPHIQLVDGEIKKDACGVCHRNVDNLFDKNSTHKIDFNITEDYSRMCTACHDNRPHPGSGSTFGKSNSVTTSHLVQLPDDMTEFWSRQQITQKLGLPLEPETNRIYCATCHNPHQEGITNNNSLSMSKKNKRGLRGEDICSFCHDI